MSDTRQPIEFKQLKTKIVAQLQTLPGLESITALELRIRDGDDDVFRKTIMATVTAEPEIRDAFEALPSSALPESVRVVDTGNAQPQVDENAFGPEPETAALEFDVMVPGTRGSMTFAFMGGCLTAAGMR
jgi:hypothetical protein